jgi:hypothetical protein
MNDVVSGKLSASPMSSSGLRHTSSSRCCGRSGKTAFVVQAGWCRCSLWSMSDKFFLIDGWYWSYLCLGSLFHRLHHFHHHVCLNPLEDIGDADNLPDTTSFIDYVTELWVEGHRFLWNLTISIRNHRLLVQVKEMGCYVYHVDESLLVPVSGVYHSVSASLWWVSTFCWYNVHTVQIHCSMWCIVLHIFCF